MTPHRSTTAALATMFVLASARPAFAGDPSPRPPLTTSSGILGEAERFLFAATAGPTAASDPSARGTLSATAERDAPAAASSAEQPFASLLPNVSLVARDWRGSMKLVGSRTMLVDDLRPTASNRMVVGRLATQGRLTGFAQVGGGEWRIDTVMFPTARSYSEVAGQIGGGFELALTPRLRVAGEAQYTMLYRSLSYTTDEVAPRILTGVLAIDGRF